MHRRLRTLLGIGGSSLVLLLVASPASAQTITSPTAPFTASNIPANETLNEPYSNALASFTITFSGFPADTQVTAEECDGNAGAGNWDPDTDCDIETEPATVLSSATGTGTFTAYDSNFGFYPFRGNSPSGLFSCVPPDEVSQNFGSPNFTNCQLRLTTEDTSTSAPETFLTISTPDPASPVIPETRYDVLLPIGALLVLGGAYVIARKRRVVPSRG